MELDRAAAAEAVRKNQVAPDGPVLEAWGALELAQAIEHELSRSAVNGWTKISIHMDLSDAARVASSLRRLAILG